MSNKMRFVLYVLALFLIETNSVRHVNAAMNEKQLKAAVKLVRNTCQPKSKATNEDIDKMHAGDWNVDRKAMCYMNCVLVGQKLMDKDNTVDFDFVASIVKKTLPEPRRNPTIASMEMCKDSIKTSDDKCISSYELAKCFYESNPSNYFLP